MMLMGARSLIADPKAAAIEAYKAAEQAASFAELSAKDAQIARAKLDAKLQAVAQAHGVSKEEAARIVAGDRAAGFMGDPLNVAIAAVVLVAVVLYFKGA
jgi:hypothetical protein